MFFICEFLTRRLLPVPAALGGARSIRYTELTTGVANALAWCLFSKSHHMPARVARAASAVALDHSPAGMTAIGPCRRRTTGERTKPMSPGAVARCHISSAYLLEIGNFASFSKCLHIKGRNFPDVFPIHVYIWPL